MEKRWKVFIGFEFTMSDIDLQQEIESIKIEKFVISKFYSTDEPPGA